MSAADDAAEQNGTTRTVARDAEDGRERPPPQEKGGGTSKDGGNDDHANTNEVEDDEEQEEEEDEDEEPKLKYDKLTGKLAGTYRNGDSTSCFTVAGNKMVIGTHSGNIHVLALPAVQTLRTYHAHSATITCCSVSPLPPPPALVRQADGSGNTLLVPTGPQGKAGSATKTPTSSSPKHARGGAQHSSLSNTPDNAIYIATSSLDGHVCVSSLIDPKDVQLRNFARPVNAVALSPEYKLDRTYLSGGRAGHLILTTGGKAGVSSDANTNSAAAAASGWLGTIGIGSNTGKDSILHQGEGAISAIKWSLSGKWVVWVNEEGVKIMRSHLRLGSEGSEDAWRRIAHAAKPDRKAWEEMAGVWKARAQWVDDHGVESDDADHAVEGLNRGSKLLASGSTKAKKTKGFEKLVVGWGDTAWILHVHEGGIALSGPQAGKRQIGSVDIFHKLQFRDCVVSSLSLYSPSLLAILAYRTIGDDDKPISSSNDLKDTPRRGRAHKHTGIAPQLRLVNVRDGEEVDVDELPMSRFQTLSAQDYHLESLWIPPPISQKSAVESKGALEGLWEASGGHYASKMFSSGASVLSRSSSGADDDARKGSSSGKGVGNSRDLVPTELRHVEAHPYLLEPGLKLFIQSPYDCVLAVRRGLSDHLDWLLKHQQYAQAWGLVDEHPEVIDSSNTDQRSLSSAALDSPSRTQQSLSDFLQSDDTASQPSGARENSAAAREKRRIGDLWLARLVATDKWDEAGQVARKVIQDGNRWEHWVLYFAQAGRFDEITPSVPTAFAHPPIPSIVYEVILGHYIVTSPARVAELLDEWEEGIFEASAIVSAIEARLASGEVKSGSEDWKALLEALGRLYLGLAEPRKALKCYIRTQNAERAFDLIQGEKVADALGEDVPGILTLKLNKEQLQKAPLEELDESSEQAVKLLVEEAHRGTVAPGSVVRQLRQKGPAFQPFLFFYLRTLWKGTDRDRTELVSRRKFNRAVDEGHAMVEDHADLAVDLFAEYDRQTLLEFLKTSEVYDYSRAATICEKRHYIPELVLVLSKTGQLKQALWLIIGELGDVAQAIAFVKQNPDLWDDLLEYGMDKPRFIRGLLEEVGTSVNPVELVKRIPEGLEVPGLKDGILKLVQGWEVQVAVSRGVERVLRGEVLAGMEVLRQGQRRGVRFEVLHEAEDAVDLAVVAQPLDATEQAKHLMPDHSSGEDVQPGHCVGGCGEVFHEDGTPSLLHPSNGRGTGTDAPIAEKEPLLGFACGHVYHLSCLLRMDEATADPEVFDRVMSQLGYGGAAADGEREEYTGRSVGAKVAHAHIIRNVVRGGCRRCPSIAED